MTKTEYLDNLGYNNQEWQVLTADEAASVIGKPDQASNMLPIHDPRGKTAFGEGAYIVLSSWYNVHKPQEQAPIPAAPQQASTDASSGTIPAPAPAPASDVQQPKEITPLLKTRLMNLVGKGWTDTGAESISSPDNVVYTYSQIEEMSNEDYTSFIKVVPAETENPQVTEEAKEDTVDTQQVILEARTKKLSQIGLELVDDKFIRTIGEETFGIEKDKVLALDATGFETSFNGMKSYAEKLLLKEKVIAKPRVKQLIEAGLELSEDFSELFLGGGLKIVISTLDGLSEEDFQKCLEGVKNPQSMMENVKDDSSDNNSNIEEAEIVEDDQNNDTVSEKEKQKVDIAEEEHRSLEEDSNDIGEGDSVVGPSADELLTTGDTRGFFGTLIGLGFQQLNLSINKLDNGKFNVIVKPKNFSGDAALDDISPLTMTATPEELDESFFEVLVPPAKEVHGIMTNAHNFLEDAKKKEEATKAAKEKKDKVKKLIDAAKKYHDKEDFDASKTTSKNTAKKKWDAVLELDPKNKEALAGLQKLREQITAAGGKLNFG